VTREEEAPFAVWDDSVSAVEARRSSTWVRPACALVPVGCAKTRSRGSLVLVDQSAEEVAAAKVSRGAGLGIDGRVVAVWRHLDSLRTKDIVKSTAELVSRSWISTWNCGSCSPSYMMRLRACWVTQAPSGLAVQAMNSSRRVASERKKST